MVRWNIGSTRPAAADSSHLGRGNRRRARATCYRRVTRPATFWQSSRRARHRGPGRVPGQDTGKPGRLFRLAPTRECGRRRGDRECRHEDVNVAKQRRQRGTGQLTSLPAAHVRQMTAAHARRDGLAQRIDDAHRDRSYAIVNTPSILPHMLAQRSRARRSHRDDAERFGSVSLPLHRAAKCDRRGCGVIT